MTKYRISYCLVRNHEVEYTGFPIIAIINMTMDFSLELDAEMGTIIIDSTKEYS